MKFSLKKGTLTWKRNTVLKSIKRKRITNVSIFVNLVTKKWSRLKRGIFCKSLRKPVKDNDIEPPFTITVDQPPTVLKTVCRTLRVLFGGVISS